MKVLIIEDEKDKSRMLSSYMEKKFGATAEWVTNERDAKARLSDTGSYDTVLLDMTLPDMVNIGDLDSYGGMNILSYMENDGIIIPVLVITSYWDFKHLLMRETKQLYSARNILFQQEVDYDDVDIVEDFDYLDRMHQYMSYTYSQVYFGSIEFSYRNESWKHIIDQFMEDLIQNEYINIR